MSVRASLRIVLSMLVVSLCGPVLAQEHAENTPKRAMYAGLEDDQFLTKWLVLGPIPVAEAEADAADEQKQRAAFTKMDLDLEALEAVQSGASTVIAGNPLTWQYVSSSGPVIDLDALYEGVDYAAAFAIAQIEAPAERTVFLGLGSDDGVRVWLNGELVHDNWIPRGVIEDDDVFPITLRSGSNTLLLKVQDMQQGWGFVVRPLAASTLPKHLVSAAGRGQLDQINALLRSGVDVDAAGPSGITALHAARIQGRQRVVDELIEHGADSSIEMPRPESLARGLLGELTDGKTPGAAILVARDGEILFQEGVGLADVDNATPITPNTKFRIGSITKQFTAAGILKLQEQGRLRVNDPLSKFIPEFPRGDEVTIYHLLTHTSGVHSYTDEPKFIAFVTDRIDEVALVDTIKTYTFDFDPGTDWRYSNSGYFLLGHLISLVSGMPYDEYLRTAFFEPLGMDDTGMHERGAALTNEARGYSYENGEFNLAIDWDMSWAGGAGAMYSTVGDLYRWNEALFGGRVLSAESIDAAFTPATLSDGRIATGLGSPYGLGWALAEQRGAQVIAHGGGLHGFTTYLARHPKYNFTVAVLANCLPARNVDPSGISQELSNFYLWTELGAQQTYASIDVDAARLDDYVGRYEYMGGAVLVVTRDNDRLFAQLTGQNRFEIFPNGDDSFFWRVVDAQITFVRGADGRVQHGIHRQNGAEMEVPKLPEEQPAAVDPSVFARLVGEYQLSPGANLSVTTEGDRLFVQLTGQPRFEIFPRSETEYYLREVSAAISFDVSDSGEVSSAVLQQGGREIPLQRVQ